MTITAMDIYNQEFKKRLFNGYDLDEVDSFLEAIAKGFEELTKENQEVADHIKQLETQLEEYQHKEQSVYEALLQAHQYGEEAKGTAERESELILRKAKFEANRIIRHAEDKASQIRQEFGVLRQKRENFNAEYRALLHAQLKMLARAEQQEALSEQHDALSGDTDVAKGADEMAILEGSTDLSPEEVQSE